MWKLEVGSGNCRSTDFQNKSFPAILTRSRKRKSSVLQDKYLDDSAIENDEDHASVCSSKERQQRRSSLRSFARHSATSEDDEYTPPDFKQPSRKDKHKKMQSRAYKSSDEESVLSSLSVDDSLSGRSTPPHSKIHMPLQEESQNLNCQRPSPLPPVSFANCTEVWELMCKMDIKYKKPVELFKNHPVLSAQMRTILLDWIMDVCEAYQLHRETLYLTVDYLDRYIALQSNVLRQHLQLIGITCLFIASKVEEIYPPKLNTFAYVTDGACTEAEILDMELVVMKTLKWKLSPITPANWLNVYLQILSINPCSTRSGSFNFLRTVRLHRDLKPEDSRICRPQYAGVDFVRAIRIVDLTILDIASLRYTYSMLAAAAIYHTKGRAEALGTSGFSWEVLAPCALWMAPYANIVRRAEVPDVLPGIKNVPDEARHLIQSHCISLDMLQHVQLLQSSNKICSPMTLSEGLLTPPRSSEKYRKSKH